MNRICPMMATALIAISPAAAPAQSSAPAQNSGNNFLVGPQYDTTHVYVAPEDFDRFVTSFIATFGRTASKQGVFQVTPTDSKSYRRLRMTSGYGKMNVMVSGGQLPWPYGRDMTGYEVGDLTATLAKAKAAGVETLVPPHAESNRTSAIVRFPGGYIAEVHAPVKP
ncbi:MAG: hypothetical protein QHC67_07360 [Sphingobium sp.]|uniref:hypothetical protein n=1 Tax=Sphingobium sp. TaxID=1912891 RepID=UPI0029ADCAF1|nr:hypothetical protein [Sphingobium sp.]MDX3909623.1 hypothetical protein [Sphingobium sp.]